LSNVFRQETKKTRRQESYTFENITARSLSYIPFNLSFLRGSGPEVYKQNSTIAMSLQRPLHRYANLPDNSIRLLRLLPHKDEDEPIQCQLFNCSLERSRGTRPYEALSYVWGSDHGSQSISIGSCHQPVGGNLFAALLHLRDPSIERILWIDALCINQQDNIEKGHQVQSMAMIYAKATRVIVWLGKATPGIDQALEDIRIASVAAKQTTTLAKNENAILKLLEAAWFRRVWVRT